MWFGFCYDARKWAMLWWCWILYFVTKQVFYIPTSIWALHFLSFLHIFTRWKNEWMSTFNLSFKLILITCVVRRHLIMKALPLDVWRCCFMSIPLLSIIVSCLVLTEPVFWLMCFDADGVFPLLLLCDSSLSDSLEVRNNVSTLFWTSQINVAYLTIQFPCPSSRGWFEVKHKW